MTQNTTPALSPSTARQFDLIIGALSRGFRSALRASELAETKRLPELDPAEAWLRVEKYRDLLTHMLTSIGQFHHQQCLGTAPAEVLANNQLGPDAISSITTPDSEPQPDAVPVPEPDSVPEPDLTPKPDPAPAPVMPTFSAQPPVDTGDLLPEFAPANVEDLNSLFEHIASTAPKSTALQRQQRENALRTLVRYRKEHLK